MSQQQEQNKTAKQWLKDRGFVVETVEQAFDFDRQAQQLEEYASQQTASLQKQVEELREENEQLKVASEAIQIANIVAYATECNNLDKKLEEMREENNRLMSLFRQARNYAGFIGDSKSMIIADIIDKALNPQDNQK